MEEQWIVDRVKLRQLMLEKPDWTNQQYADACGRCKSWVKKWKKRLGDTHLDNDSVMHSQSRARKTPPEPYHPQVIERILALRDQPPIEVPRKIGPRTILYYLHHDEELVTSQYRLPRSTGTIWKILDQHQRIVSPTTKSVRISQRHVRICHPIKHSLNYRTSHRLSILIIGSPITIVAFTSGVWIIRGGYR